MPTEASPAAAPSTPSPVPAPVPAKTAPKRRGPAKRKGKRRAAKPKAPAGAAKAGILPDVAGGNEPPRVPPGFVAVQSAPGNWSIIPQQHTRTEFPAPESIIPGVVTRFVALDPTKLELRQGRGHTHTLFVRVPDRREFAFTATRVPTAGDIFDAVSAVKQKLDGEEELRRFKAAQNAERERVENSRG
jgi:hypothetical protein